MSTLEARTIGRHSWCDPVGELVDELESLGYVVRRPDPTGRRAKLITLTARAATRWRRARRQRAVRRSIVEALGERGWRQLGAMLLKLLRTPPGARR